jgi:hypothetical protein
MAKKKAGARGDVNVSAAIREALTESPNLTGKETLAAVSAKYPDATINEKSFQVAYSVIRGKMGLGGRRKAKVRRPRPGAKTVSTEAVVARPAVSASAEKVSLAQVQLAQEFVAKVGGAKAALAALEQLNKLQVR